MKGKRKENQKQMKSTSKNSNAKKQTSIKFKLVGILIPVVIFVIIFLIVLSYTQSYHIITKDAADLLDISAKHQVNQIEGWLDENLAAFQSAKNAIESAGPEEESLQNLLNAFAGYNSNYEDGLYIADERGKVLAASNSKVHKGEAIKKAVWYKEGLSRINMAFGPAYTNGNGEQVISASGMLLDSSGEIKVISADVRLDRISIIVNSLVEMDNAEAILIDLTDSTILAARDTSLISTTLDSGNSNPLYRSIAEKLAIRDFTETEMNQYMVDFQKVSGTNWVLVSYVPTSSILGELYKLRTFMIIVGVIFVLLLIVLIERIMHIVLKPIKMLTQTIVTMGKGDFSVDVTVKGNDEISLMSQSVKEFISGMRTMISEIHSISEKLFQQSEGSSQIASQLFDSSELQSDSMNNLNTTVDELAHSVNEIADSASTLAHFVSETSTEGTQVSNKMQETVTISEKGREDMEKVQAAMTNIEHSIKTLEEAINKVGNASHEITDIISVIGNIAEETSLLSLNASIEAARAGEAGKGFAVVASEIGKLSNTSTQAVQNIEKLIEQILGLVKNTVEQSKESTAYIKESSQKITTAAVTFEDIFDAIQATNSRIEKMLEQIGHVDNVATNVAAISQEQAASSEEILATSEEMVHQAKAIADNSKDVARDSQQLEETAEKLGQQVQLFKL